MVLRWLPVTHNTAIDAASAAGALGDSPIKSVLRSKGFMWLSNKHTTAFFWSHAGERGGGGGQGVVWLCRLQGQLQAVCCVIRIVW